MATPSHVATHGHSTGAFGGFSGDILTLGTSFDAPVPHRTRFFSVKLAFNAHILVFASLLPKPTVEASLIWSVEDL